MIDTYQCIAFSKEYHNHRKPVPMTSLPCTDIPTFNMALDVTQKLSSIATMDNGGCKITGVFSHAGLLYMLDSWGGGINIHIYIYITRYNGIVASAALPPVIQNDLCVYLCVG